MPVSKIPNSVPQLRPWHYGNPQAQRGLSGEGLRSGPHPDEDHTSPVGTTLTEGPRQAHPPGEGGWLMLGPQPGPAPWGLSDPIRLPLGSDATGQAVPAVPQQSYSWGISQPQAAKSSFFFFPHSALLAFEQPQTAKAPALSPGQGWSQEQQPRLGWEQGAAGPAQGETGREGGQRRPKPPRACVFFERQLFQHELPKEHAIRIPASSPAPEGSARGQCGAAAWVLAGWDLSKKRNTGSPFWM